MLVLTRSVGETIVIGDNIEVTLIEIRGDKARLGVTADRSIVVDRLEVHFRRKAALRNGQAGWQGNGEATP